MLTATLVQPKRFDIAARDVRSPGAGEVLIAVDGCGVCASNLGPWTGVQGVRYPLEPGAPGHEVYGRIAAVGAGVDGLAPGDAVTALSYNGFAAYDIARADAVVRLPPTLAGRAVPGEPVACAVNVVGRAGVQPSDTVVVLGVGFLGALVLALVCGAGNAHVIAVSRRSTGREVAERMGADDAISYEDDIAGRVAEATSGRMADVVIEATGQQQPLDLAAELVRIRGRLVIAGYHQDGVRTVNLQLWNWRGLDVINAHERDTAVYSRGMREGVRLLESGLLELDPLLSHRFPLAEINRAFQAMEARPDGFVKAIVVPGADR